MRNFSVVAAANCFEWYDFSLFFYLTPVLTRWFFPTLHQYHAYLLASVIFALGYWVRPLGAMLFGYIADTQGRKRALLYSIIMLNFLITVMIFIPSYHTIGLAAPIIL
jgi:MFS transporter, MHS family, proline/betaine transporter